MDLKFENLEGLQDIILQGLNAGDKWACYPVNKSAMEATDVVCVALIKDANEFCAGKQKDDPKTDYRFQPIDNFVSFLENSLLHKAYPEHRRGAISDNMNKLNITAVDGQNPEELLILLSRGDFALVQVNKTITPIDHIKRYLVIFHQANSKPSKFSQNSSQTNILGGFHNYASAHKCFVESMPKIATLSAGKTKKLFLALQYDNIPLELRADGWPEVNTGTILKTAQKEGEYVKVVNNTDPFVSCTVPQKVIARFDGMAGSLMFYDEKLKVLPVLPILKSIDVDFFDHTPLAIQQSRRLKPKLVAPVKNGRRPRPGKH